MSLIIADSALRIYCVNGECYMHHPIKQKSYDIKMLENKALRKFMSYISKPKSKADAHAFLSRMLNIRHEVAVYYLKSLHEKGLVKEVNAANEESLSWAHCNWAEAEVFHQHTVNTPRFSYAKSVGNAQDVALMERYVNEKPPPANYKTCGGEKIALEKPELSQAIKIGALFEKMKKSEYLTLDKLSRLLYYAFGKVGLQDMQVTGKHILKTVPSGGCRHPYEFYLFVHNVDGLAPGAYHYQFNDHFLTKIRSFDKKEVKKIIDQDLLIDETRFHFLPQMAIVYACVFERSMHRYRYSRSYRVMQYDLGHIYQNLAFLARAHSLNIYAGYSCHEEKIEKALGLDSITESCMGYAVL